MSDQQQKPVVTVSIDPETGIAKFVYDGPYPIGVHWSINKNGHVSYKEDTLEPGDTAIFTPAEGILSVSCHYGYTDHPVEVTLPRLAQAS